MDISALMTLLTELLAHPGAPIVLTVLFVSTAQVVFAMMGSRYLEIRGPADKSEHGFEPPPPAFDLPPDDDIEDDEEDPEDKSDELEDDSARSERLSLDDLLQRVVSYIAFAQKKEYAGRRVVGHRAVGRYQEEGIIPSAGVQVRPMRNFSEIPNLLITELGHDEDDLLVRIATGKALVAMPLENRDRMEPIHEEVYRVTVQVVYILVDLSGSMFPGLFWSPSSWKQKVWKALLRSLANRSREAEAICMMRPFSYRPHELIVAQGREEYQVMQHAIQGFGSRGGTDIGAALRAAIHDVTAQEFDSADIFIVTDGEDEELPAQAIRNELDKAGIKLHGIMIGEDNRGLRSCCDVYQTISDGYYLEGPFHRGTAV